MNTTVSMTQVGHATHQDNEVLWNEKQGFESTQGFLHAVTFQPYEDGGLSQEEPLCVFIPDRPATWLVRGKDLKISPLAAAILLNDNLLTVKDLSVIQSAYLSSVHDQGPSNPISGILTAANRTIVGIVGGLVDYPVVMSKIATSDAENGKRHAASFVFNSNKGLSRMVGTSLKAPMEFTAGISEGFHNTPKLWGDDTVRQLESVTGVKSGFKAAGKGLGLGFYDGITGLVTQPIKGAQEGGIGGFVIGFFRGIGGVACKPTAGAAGLPAYALRGFYEEFRKKRGAFDKTSLSTASIQQGWEEFAVSTVEQRNEVLKGWHKFANIAVEGGFKIQMA